MISTFGIFRRFFSSAISTTKKVVFSGVQPTGSLHLGNYFGAVNNWVCLQKDSSIEKFYISVVDLHAITTLMDDDSTSGDQLRKSARSITATLLACGVRPDRCVLFQQSRIAQHCELMWTLTCLTSMARLARLAQFKDRSAKYKEGNVPLGVYVYPVLQAADILLYRATHVPVGDDQRQHLDVARDLAQAFNRRYQTDVFPVPEYAAGTFARVKSLRDPKKKMSKSDPDPLSRVDLIDSPEAITEKFKKALTDMDSRVAYEPISRPAVSNLINIHSMVTGLSTERCCAEAENINTGQYKLRVAECVIEKFRPVRTEYERLINDASYLDSVLAEGAEKASMEASKTMTEVKRLVGLN